MSVTKKFKFRNGDKAKDIVTGFDINKRRIHERS
jgi:hypothetical protein